MSPFIIFCMALLIDYFLGEPKHYHPLVGFGHYAKYIERTLNKHYKILIINISLGFLSVFLALVPFYLLINILLEQLLIIDHSGFLLAMIEAVILYFTIGLHSLKKHADNIYQSLLKNNLTDARLNVAMIVSRDTDKMQSNDVARATIESVLENGSDAVFAPVFWFFLAGIPGVLCYRIINTLDAMWGYKTPQYQYFGYAAAKLDDILNYIPARMTALSYALMGNWNSAIQCWRTQADNWSGINPGVVMAAGAGALGNQLGGGDYYHGEYIDRPLLGQGKTADKEDIPEAIKLLNRVIFLYVSLGLCLLFLVYFSEI